MMRSDAERLVTAYVQPVYGEATGLLRARARKMCRGPWFHRALGIVLLPLLLVPSEGDAQELRLRLLHPDGTTAAAGVLVEAVRVAIHDSVHRGVTSSTGLAVLRLGRPGHYRIRALRIGFSPTELGEVLLASGEVYAPSPMLLDATRVRLDSVRVSTIRTCGATGLAGSFVAGAIAQARFALAASTMPTPDGVATAFWRRFQIFVDQDLTPLIPLRFVHHQSPTETPFQSIGVDSLLRRGFVYEERGSLRFSAPDAKVLLSTEFVQRHCFQAAAADYGNERWIGVDFEPSPGAAFGAMGGIAGTIWIDRESSELRRVTFRFVGAGELIGDAVAGGALSFRRLSSGAWFIDRWELRMPRTRRFAVADVRDRAPPTSVIVTEALEVVGGVVDSVRLDGVMVFARRMTSEEVLPEIASRVGDRPSCPIAGRMAEEPGMLFGQVIDARGNPVHGHTVRASWLESGRSRFASPELREQRDHRADAGFFVFCGLPIGVPVRLALLANLGVSASVRLTLEDPSQSTNLTVKAR